MPMLSSTRLDVYQTIHAQGMMPLFYEPDPAQAQAVLAACYAGGCRLMEFTNRGGKALPVFMSLVEYAEAHLPGMILGVGSIPDAPTAAMFIQAGARFIVTPSLRQDVVILCNRRKIACLPGCATLTEVGQAEEWGCEIVKLFPAGVYGPNMIKSIKGPQPWSSIMPTGGVSPDPDNLKGWIEAGAVCVGMGSKLMARQADGSYDVEQIQAQSETSLAHIARLRAAQK